jgi:hypothetical protein
MTHPSPALVTLRQDLADFSVPFEIELANARQQVTSLRIEIVVCYRKIKELEAALASQVRTEVNGRGG